MQKLAVIPETRTETTLPVMPIKRDKAMASLTETEVAVLEFLSSEGPKTAPEIKEKVQLSREHTARLMKKLYEQGYLERETDKLPFKYSVKKEMEKLLKKTETPLI
jgi:DNA-binding MarR family transcriptional regulator